MRKIPSMSSRELVKLLIKSGAFFVRQGKTDHAIYARIFDGRERKWGHYVASILLYTDLPRLLFSSGF